MSIFCVTFRQSDVVIETVVLLTILHVTRDFMRPGLLLAALPIFLAATFCAAQETSPAEWKPDDAGFRSKVLPFLQTHCERCHGGKLAESDLRVDRDLTSDVLDPAGRSKWEEVVNVLNSHEMPPEDEKQPTPDEVAKIVDWVTSEMARGELLKRETVVVMRRLNRVEYRNTIRDLLGVDFDTAVFPEDPSACGFDNVGEALSLSPLHVELYFDAAQKILNEVFVTGEQPPSLKWRFQPESGNSDSNRVTYDGQRLIVNAGNNPVQDDQIIIHHNNWDKKFNVRDFRLPYKGKYIVRIRAASKLPTREDVVAGARAYLEQRIEKSSKENPREAEHHRQMFERDLNHFRNDRMYDYGPARIKLVQDLGGQPRVVAEFDVDATVDSPKVFEIPLDFTTESAGLTIEYDYSIPNILENFWMQTGEQFARPELSIDWMELEGPVYEQWPPEPKTRLTSAGRLAGREESQQAEAIIASLMRKAYRRPVTKQEIDEKLALYRAARQESPTPTDALKLPLTAILVSPYFLYLTEPVEQGSTRQTLSPHQLASRLSYFLWCSMPDDELSRLADTGEINQPDILKQQISRLLKDAKSRDFVTSFAGQWLGLREVGANPPAEDLFPQYDRHLEVSIIKESEEFFAHILGQKLSVMNFVKSDFVVINERLARFYDIPNVRGDHFRAVKVPTGINRGGVVTQASMLTITSNGTRTSPVKRGTWVMKNVLGIDPGLPVANAGEIAPKVPGIDKATVRQRLEIHRSLPQCARCHNKIDPLGLALENFNASGEWRDQEGFGYKGRIERDDPRIDASAALLDGTPINGVQGLQEALVAREDLFLTCLTRKLMTFALGRELALSDEQTIKAIVKDLREPGHDTLPNLIELIVLSEQFQTR